MPEKIGSDVIKGELISQKSIKLPPSYRKVSIFMLDRQDLSNEAFNRLKKELKNHGLYLGDAARELNYYSSDAYIIYIAKRKLTTEELKSLFGH